MGTQSHPNNYVVGGRHWCLLIKWSKTTTNNLDKALEKSLENWKADQTGRQINYKFGRRTSRHALQTAKRDFVHLNFHFIFMLPYYI